MDHASEIAQLEHDLGVLRGLADRAIDEGDALHFKAIASVLREKKRRLARLEFDEASPGQGRPRR